MLCQQTVAREVKKMSCEWSKEEVQRTIDIKLDLILCSNLKDEYKERLKIEAAELAKILLRRKQ